MFKDIILSWYNLLHTPNDFDIKMISIFKANPFDIKCSWRKELKIAELV